MIKARDSDVILPSPQYLVIYNILSSHPELITLILNNHNKRIYSKLIVFTALHNDRIQAPLRDCVLTCIPLACVLHYCGEIWLQAIFFDLVMFEDFSLWLRCIPSLQPCPRKVETFFTLFMLVRFPIIIVCVSGGTPIFMFFKYLFVVEFQWEITIDLMN